MKDEGPPLDLLMRRLAETPSEMLAEPRLKHADGSVSGTVRVDCLVHDTIMHVSGGTTTLSCHLVEFRGDRLLNRARLRLVLLACWVFHDLSFEQRYGCQHALGGWLGRGLEGVDVSLTPERIIADADRREEFIRHCLTAIELRPAGETEAQAEDRLHAVDTAATSKLAQEMRGRREWARKLRQEMAEKAARESATRMSGEW